MDFSVIFARHFARLIWLIRSQPDSVDDQKGALRAIVTVAKEGSVVLRPEGGRLLANGTPLPDILTGVKDVTTALSGAVQYALKFEQGSPPADILSVARLIATDSPDPIMQRVAQLAPRSVKMESVREDTEASRARPTAQLSAELVAEIEADKAKVEAAEAAAAAAAAGVAPEPAAAPEGITGDAKLDGLFVSLMKATDPKAAEKVVEELVTRLDVHAREGKIQLVLRGTTALIELEKTIVDQDVRRVYVINVRKVFKPQVLRVVMPAVSREAEQRDMLRELLEAAAEEGATIVFEEIQRARTMAERTSLMTLLKELPAAISALRKLVTDTRWHVVRTAVEVIGEVGGPDAERSVADALRHPDERVRRSATAVIARFDSEFAVDALYRSLSDPSSPVRLQAVHGLELRRNNPKAASVVVNAIDDEPEIEVQLAEIAALGRFATSDAVNKLARAAEPDGRIFRRKNPAYRIAAVQALAEARTPAAMATLQSLQSDRERDVREAVARVMK